MSNYVALLRGINVGGKNLIKMEQLRAEFEKIGFNSVKTYIQSGNVLFQSEETNTAKLETVIKQAIVAKFQLDLKVIVKSQQELSNIISQFPKIFTNPDWKHNVIFLSKKIDNKTILAQFLPKPDIEELSYQPGVLFWSAKLATIGRSTMLKLSTRSEYQEMTVRNINTTVKLAKLMNDL